jgi:hypothetical protein
MRNADFRIADLTTSAYLLSTHPNLFTISNRLVERLTDADSIEDAERRIRKLIDGHGEWLCVQVSQGAATPLRNSDCDFRITHGRLIFSCWGVEGALTWRILAWEWTGEKLLLEATRRMGALSAQLELIPRASVEAMTATISATRRERCLHLARLALSALQGAKIERAGLSAGSRPNQPGRYARIMLRKERERIAVSGAVVDSERSDVDAFLSSTLIWFTRASERARPPYIQKLWLIVLKDCVESLMERLALLRDDLRRVIALYQINDCRQQLTRLTLPSLEEILEVAPERFRRPAREAISESASRIVELAPEAIDVVRSRRGETLRFHGLAFARVRRVMNSENVWFGIEGARRRLLDESTQGECTKLLLDLKEHRRAESSDRNHALYRASPEAWLESLLRRDVTQLDPGLRLAPLYAQFRSSHKRDARPIDLLALRRDGRLVVIELKVAEDREHVLQGADYWRRVEAHRLRGHISQSKIFGEAEIAHEPPLVYLVAPTLRFHRAFHTLARAITPAIEIYRFDINENWRAGIRVMRRCDLT